MNSRILLRRPRGAQAGTLTLPCYEQQNTAEKTNRHKSVLSRCHLMNGRSLLRRPTGPQAGILRCHVMNSRALLRKTQEGAQDSWCTPGEFLVHSWAFLVHSWFTPGALLVHSWCTLGALQRFPERELLFFPKGSLDPPFRNVWIAFSLTYKPEKELHCFRKEASILRTETFGSPFRQFANPKGNCTASERKSRSSAQKTFWIAFLPTCKPGKGIAPLPKGSLDPPHRNVWIAQELTTFIT